MSSPSVKLIAVGDVMAPKAPPSLFDAVVGELLGADLVFGNCEWPYSEEAGDTHPVEAHLNDFVDEGDLFVPGEPESVRMIGRAGFDVMSFANNHCLHAGYRAFFRTIELLRESGIAPVGAGANIDDAMQPVVMERNGVRVAFVACSSALLPGTHASRRTPGIVPLRRHSYFKNVAWELLGLNPDMGTLVDREDLRAMCGAIDAARRDTDFVIVSCHWGILEDRVAVGDYQREAAHAFIDSGADLILGHGPLVTKGIEVYRTKAIFYCLGKFVMVSPAPVGETPIGVTVPFGDESRNGIAAYVELHKGENPAVSFRPCWSDDRSFPHLLDRTDERFSVIVDDIRSISEAAGLGVTLAVEGDLVAVR